MIYVMRRRKNTKMFSWRGLDNDCGGVMKKNAILISALLL